MDAKILRTGKCLYHAGQQSLSGVQADVEVEVESTSEMDRYKINHYKTYNIRIRKHTFYCFERTCSFFGFFFGFGESSDVTSLLFSLPLSSVFSSDFGGGDSAFFSSVG